MSKVHRLWDAPENLRTTYLPDDDPLNIAGAADGLLVTPPVQARTGLQKSLAITLPGPQARVVVDHRLHNRGSVPVELAPWAITQLKPGGLAILPQATAPADEHGLLPNRHPVFWPYTQIDSPHSTGGDRFLTIAATMRDGALKIGWPNPAGWLAYVLNGALCQAGRLPTRRRLFGPGQLQRVVLQPAFSRIGDTGTAHHAGPP